MKFLYYLIHWTWGLPMNIIGLIVFCIAKVCNWPIVAYRNAIRIQYPYKSFGGLELGMFFIIGKSDNAVSAHEYGHSIQMLWWGWLFPFVIGIPSALRYWYREFAYYKQGKMPPVPYDAIWFEGQATTLGELATSDRWSWL